jgi:hypothetical protein
MRNRLFFIGFIFLLFQSGLAVAGEVRVFKPMEQELSHMQLRSQAMAEGFAQAVLEDAQIMLPGDMDEVRTELFKQYLILHAKPYVQEYKVLSFQDMDAGLILRLDVKVNKRTLRDGLKRMGFFATLKAPQVAAMVVPEGMSEEAAVQLQGLVTLSGMQVADVSFPSFTLELAPEGAYKGRLVIKDREWVAINKDLAVLWFDLWGRFFTRSELMASRVKAQTLSVSGWFSPDAVLEFDRILRGWDSAVQEVQLVEMDMQSTGVGASWNVRILNSDRLNMMLQAFLPQRGLSFQLSEDVVK